MLATTLDACGGGAPPAVRAGESSTLRAVPNGVTLAFSTIDDADDPSFNELLGINNEGKASGYYGDGSAGHPSIGYVVYPPYLQLSFRNEEYPGASGTVVTSLNNKHQFAGYYADNGGAIFGFIQTNGLWSKYRHPGAKGRGSKTELLGINDLGYAVGIYSAASAAGAFELDEATAHFSAVTPGKSASKVQATGINGAGDICGYYTTATGKIVGFLLRQGTYHVFSYPGSSDTRALGITLQDRIVGSYFASGVRHAFLLTDPLRQGGTWESFDDPSAVGKTVATSINVHNDVVGYYVDASGNTNGFVAVPLLARR
jgi:hypothetical protein